MPRSHSDLSFWKGPPRSFGGPFFVLRTVSVSQTPCLALQVPIVAALLREIRPVAVAGGRVGFAGSAPLSLQVARPAPFTEYVLLPSLGLVRVSRVLPRRRCWGSVPFADSALLALLARVVLPACFVGGGCSLALAVDSNGRRNAPPLLIRPILGHQRIVYQSQEHLAGLPPPERLSGPVVVICPLQKQKSRSFCNFFAIADPCLPLKGGNGPPNKEYCCAFAVLLAFEGLATIRNRKKVAENPEFLFSVPPGTAS